jgi:hypothetical protein
LPTIANSLQFGADEKSAFVPTQPRIERRLTVVRFCMQQPDIRPAPDRIDAIGARLALGHPDQIPLPTPDIIDQNATAPRRLLLVPTVQGRRLAGVVQKQDGCTRAAANPF